MVTSSPLSSCILVQHLLPVQRNAEDVRDRQRPGYVSSLFSPNPSPVWRGHLGRLLNDGVDGERRTRAFSMMVFLTRVTDYVDA